MYGVELICTDEGCDFVVEATLWRLEQAEYLVCDGCCCILHVAAVWESTDARAFAGTAPLSLAA